jgi:hypothetical protein
MEEKSHLRASDGVRRSPSFRISSVKRAKAEESDATVWYVYFLRSGRHSINQSNLAGDLEKYFKTGSGRTFAKKRILPPDFP